MIQKQIDRIEMQIKLYISADDIITKLLEIQIKERENYQPHNYLFDYVTINIQLFIQVKRVILGEIYELQQRLEKFRR
jgi:hypothetical protein